MKLFELFEELKYGIRYSVVYRPAKSHHRHTLKNAQVVVGQQLHLIGYDRQRIALGAGTHIILLTELTPINANTTA